MAGPSWPLCRIAGIPVRVHWTLAMILVMLLLRDLWSFGLLGAVLGLAIGVLVFGSVLFHELCHALTARSLGQRTFGIELHAFGGLASVSGSSRDRDDLLVAAAGPASNFLLWLLFSGVVQVSPLVHVRWIASTVAGINLMLGLFNLIPAYPLDGGLILLATMRMRRPPGEAEYLTYTAGKWIALAMLFAGIVTNDMFMVLIFLSVWQSCEDRLGGGYSGWVPPPRAPRPIVIHWEDYKPRRPSLWERFTGLFRKSASRNTPVRLRMYQDEPDPGQKPN
jgi:Zn-dependent protease